MLYSTHSNDILLRDYQDSKGRSGKEDGGEGKREVGWEERDVIERMGEGGSGGRMGKWEGGWGRGKEDGKRGVLEVSWCN